MHESTADALEVNTAVLKETVVLNGHRGFLHGLRDLVQRNFFAVEPVEARDLLAVGIEHARLFGQRPFVKLRGQGVEYLKGVVRTDGCHTHGWDCKTCTDDSGNDADGNELHPCRESRCRRR